MSGKSNAAEDKSKEGGEAPAKAKGLPPMMVKMAILFGILVVLLVGAVAVVTFVIAPKLRAQAPQSEEVQSGEHGAAAGGEHGDAHGKGGHDDKAKHAAHGEIVELGDVVVNPAGTGGRRYLKVSVSLEVKDAKVAKLVEHRSAPVKDVLVRNLSSRGLEELTDPTTKEDMREQLVGEVASLFPKGSILNLYFTEYVVQ
ncbi:MAG: flagellar basal body-associated FliL family protein [Candidatus Eisenbacteria bacterium]|nr:flagellar basal body-associated FliL family protein [Candidatus Eisenbacteria bacterium]